MFCKNCGNEIGDGIKFCTKCGLPSAGLQSKVTHKKRLFFYAIVFLALLSGFLYLYLQYWQRTSAERDQEIAAAVVNIYCEGQTEEESSGGSGTILEEDGLVLTNAHVILVNDGEDATCLVILPDPSTGAPDEIYTAYPIIIPELSEQYDLAFVQIHDVFYDPEEDEAYGEFPKKFPAYDSDRYCKNENVKLGEPVRIYGYPAISGGYALTITDGVVSSLLIDEGLIITSAKISHGNSGGLAVDKNGCMIGVPSMVNGDEYESLGIIISNDLISEFAAEVARIIDTL